MKALFNYILYHLSYRVLIIFPGVYGMCTTLLAQSYHINQDLQKINTVILETKTMYMEVEYKLYFDQTLHSNNKGIIKKDHRKLYQDIGPVTVIKNDQYSTFIHHDEKIIMVDPHPDMGPIKKNDLFNINIDTLKTWLSGAEKKENGTYTTISFHLKKGRYSSISISYDPLTFLLKSMVLHQKKKYTAEDDQTHEVWMEILFNEINTQPSFSPSDFSESKFVSIKNKQVVPAQAYKNYQLINNLNKTIRYE